MLDSKGVIRDDRDNLTSQKAEFATHRKIDTLDEAMIDADVFIGLSTSDIVSNHDGSVTISCQIILTLLYLNLGLDEIIKIIRLYLLVCA